MYTCTIFHFDGDTGKLVNEIEKLQSGKSETTCECEGNAEMSHMLRTCTHMVMGEILQPSAIQLVKYPGATCMRAALHTRPGEFVLLLACKTHS